MGGSETILVVEDEEQVRAAAATILRKHGYRVLEASNGDEGLTTLRSSRQGPPLGRDVVMPRLSGQVIEKSAPYRPEMRVLFVSGYTDHGVLDAGVAFLQKPFTPRSLLGKVRDVLDAAAPEAREAPKAGDGPVSHA